MKEGLELAYELLEYAPHVWQAIGLLTIAALTAKQRKAILRRDNHQSRLRYYDEERGWHTDIDHCEDEGKDCPHLQVHHIKPQRSGGDDSPNNTITLGACQHIGKCPAQKIKDGYYRKQGKPGKWLDPDKSFIVHPDIQEALMNYNPSRDTIGEVFSQRNQAVSEGVIYWNNEHDEEMLDTARQRSINPEWWIKI